MSSSMMMMMMGVEKNVTRPSQPSHPSTTKSRWWCAGGQSLFSLPSLLPSIRYGHLFDNRTSKMAV